MTTTSDDERFHSGAEKYASYLETVEGRLRLDLTIANLEEFLPRPAQSLRAMDLGCGTGAIAVRLVQLGLHVTLVDSSLTMLDLAKSAAQKAGVAEKITIKHGDATQLATLLDAGSFDVVLCHNLLEFVDDPGAVLLAAARVLRPSSGILSVLVRNQLGEVLKSALVNADLAGAERALTAEWGDESLYGGRVRLFAPNQLKAALQESSFALIAERGVRVMSDYLPPKISRNDEYTRIFEVERKVGMRPEFVATARYTQCLAHPAGPGTKDIP